MDDFDNDMGLPDDEIAGGSEGDISDLGAGLDTEPDLVVETLPGGRSSGAVRARSAAPSAPKAAKPKAATPKAAARPKAKAKAKAKAKTPAKAAKKKSKPAKKSKAKAKKAPAKKSRKAGKKK
jgi:hypothetical protein